MFSPSDNIRYVLVWSGWLRLSHWLIAFGVLFQITSAWAISLDGAEYAFWRDWHIIVGQVVFMALGLRLVLLFLPGSSNWRALIPGRNQLRAIGETLRFYVSFARFPLPNWYAHNPLWQPLYLFILLVLLACSATGLAYDGLLLVAGQPVDAIHRFLASIISIFTVLHVVAVFLHDWKGKGAFISAMVSGYRYFHSQGAGQPFTSEDAVKKPDLITIDSILTGKDDKP